MNNENEKRSIDVEVIDPKNPKEKKTLRILEWGMLVEHHSGPLPSPKSLKQYEEIMPGLADRIVNMGESEQRFRHEIMQKELQIGREEMAEENKTVRRGQLFGLIVSLSVVSVGGVAIFMGQPLAGFGAIFTALASLVGAFIIGKKDNPLKKEVSEKKDVSDSKRNGT